MNWQRRKQRTWEAEAPVRKGSNRKVERSTNSDIGKTNQENVTGPCDKVSCS